jgi:hypothetical protein
VYEAYGVQVTPGQMQIDHGMFEFHVAEQHLDDTQVSARFEQMRRVLERRHSRPEHAVIRGTLGLITQASERTPHERVKPEQLTGQLTDRL